MTEQMIFENEQVDLSQLPSADNIEYQGIEKGYRTIQTIVSLIFTGVIITGLSIIFWFSPAPTWIAAIVLSCWILIGVLQLVFIFKGFKYRGFAIRARDLTYKKGWIFKKRVTVPFKRIQHVDIKQGPIDRKFGLAKLNVYTAGGNASDLAIPGIKIEDAHQYKSFILGVLEADDEEE